MNRLLISSCVKLKPKLQHAEHTLLVFLRFIFFAYSINNTLQYMRLDGVSMCYLYHLSGEAMNIHLSGNVRRIVSKD